MNYRPFANPPALDKSSLKAAIWIRSRHGLLLLLTCLLLGACWGDDDTPPAAAPAANTAAPVSALPTSAPALSDVAPTTITTAPTPEQAAAQLSTPNTTGAIAESATISTTPQQTPSPTAVPLEAAQASDCAVEANLDLVGYPDLEKVMGCATGPANNDPVAIDEFGDADQPIDRFMLWLGDEKKIYVLLPDGTYKTYDDTWEEGKDPTFSCNPLGGEAESPPLPRRGFGKLWCSQPELQKILGTVPRQERLCQYAVLQRFETGRLLACFEDATIRYFRILDDGKWDLQVQ